MVTRYFYEFLEKKHKLNMIEKKERKLTKRERKERSLLNKFTQSIFEITGLKSIDLMTEIYTKPTSLSKRKIKFNNKIYYF
jgi:hypothetical protein